MKPFRRRESLQLSLLTILFSSFTSANVTLNINSADSIKQTAKTVADGLVSYYTGNQPGQIPGNLPDPYYWWEAGGMFGVLIDYWYFTGDSAYNDIITQAMLHQVGPNNDFMPPNQTTTEGNDDQSFWGMAAMTAAESLYPDPPPGQPQWLALAQAVFNTQAARWDPTSCGGGLKWQIFAFNKGYDYKNTISNGAFFNMASRLAVYTGNKTYADWAEKMWDWVGTVGLRDDKYNFFDGSDDTLNCTQRDHTQWTYNAGTFLVGAANMYNYTGGQQIWADRLNGIIANLKVFLKDNDTLSETECEEAGNCNVDQRSFKAYLSRWMAATAIKAPFTYPILKPILENSAVAAAKTCTGGEKGNQCGVKWYNGSFDGNMGVGEQMSALSVIQSNMISFVGGPVSADTGGTSKGDPNAGKDSKIGPNDLIKNPITIADQALGAAITIMIVLMFAGTMYWIVC